MHTRSWQMQMTQQKTHRLTVQTHDSFPEKFPSVNINKFILLGSASEISKSRYDKNRRTNQRAQSITKPEWSSISYPVWIYVQYSERDPESRYEDVAQTRKFSRWQVRGAGRQWHAGGYMNGGHAAMVKRLLTPEEIKSISARIIMEFGENLCKKNNRVRDANDRLHHRWRKKRISVTIGLQDQP